MAKLKSGTRIYGTAIVDTSVSVGSGVTISGNGINVSGISTFAEITVSTNGINVSGVSTFAGITTVTGTTLFSRQLNVSGISTFGGNLMPSSSSVNLGNSLTRFGVGYWSDGSHYYGSNKLFVSSGTGFGLEAYASNAAYLKSNAGGGSSGNVYIDTVVGGKVIANGSGSVQILHSQNIKFETLGVGVTITGTTFTNQLNVSGVSTFNNTLNVVPTSTSIAGLFSGTTSTDMVRITQLGTGNALVVEDSANPDASPFVVGAAGSVGIGTTNPTQNLHVQGNVRITGGLYVGAAITSGTSGQVLQSTGTGVTWVSGGGGLTGIKSDGTVIASGVTINTLDFTGSGITSVSYDSGTSIASIDIRGTERRSQSFTATSNQTTFTITNGYTPGYVDVYLNGSKLQESAEFTATDGSTVVLTSGATANDIIDVVSFFLGVYSNPNYTTTRSVTRSVATASQTSFSVSYNVGYVDVYLNGSKLDSTEFTATTGSTVVLTTPATVNDVLEFISYATLSVNKIDTTVVNETTNATRYITFTDVTSGSISTARVSSSGLTFNPSTGSFSTQNIDATKVTLTQGINATGIITATGGFVGNITGNVTGNLTGTASNATNATSAGTATTATNANNVNVSDESADTTCYPVFVTTATGNQSPKTNTGFYFDSATGTLYATKFSGDGSLLTGITASDVTLDAMLFGA